jgi:hypothetical protein
LVKPCERSWAADVGVGRLAAGVVGVAGMLGVLGMDGIPAGRNAEPPVPDIPETGLIAAAMLGLGLGLEVGRGVWFGKVGFPPICSPTGLCRPEAPVAA